ncbi:hypothetical protein [uncultured Cyclobacterium sp.]
MPSKSGCAFIYSPRDDFLGYRYATTTGFGVVEVGGSSIVFL